ncbi:MAG: hypothetical protein NZ938_03195 [Aigarchaeota archaeon]|nr:hypothetical protein [Candidatus Calditenuaceae archaeon]
MDVELSIKEAFKGARRTLQYSLWEVCSSCGGSGAEPGGLKTCPTCRGTGQIVRTSVLGHMTYSVARTCETCAGRGRIVERPCRACRGLGRVQSIRSHEVEIPPGMVDGSILRFRVREGSGSGTELVLRVRIKRSPYFYARDGDLIVRVPISPSEAALGTTVRVDGPDGPIDVKIPPRTRPGAAVVARGRGLWRERGVRGDLIIRPVVVVPKESRGARKLYEQIQKSERDAMERWRSRALRLE